MLAKRGVIKAWWMVEFSVDKAYITDVTIYYRENCKYFKANYNIRISINKNES